MKQFFFILLLLFSIKVHTIEISSPHCDYAGDQNNPKLEMVFTVPTSELIITDEGISVNYKGELLSIYSLERKGKNWLVRTVGLTCRNGHPSICWYCRGCAENCSYRCPGNCQPH